MRDRNITAKFTLVFPHITRAITIRHNLIPDMHEEGSLRTYRLSFMLYGNILRLVPVTTTTEPTLRTTDRQQQGFTIYKQENMLLTCEWSLCD